MPTGKPKARDIHVPDPIAIIQADKDANRTDQFTPFGQTVWNGDTQTTGLSPQMQAMSDRMFSLGMQDSQRAPMPDFLKDIAGGVMRNVGERYGVNKQEGAQGMPQPQEFTQPLPGAQVGQMEPPINPNQGSSLEEQIEMLRGMIDNSGGNFNQLINTRMR